MDPALDTAISQSSSDETRITRKSARSRAPVPEGMPCPICSCHFPESKIADHVELCLIRCQSSSGSGGLSSPSVHATGSKNSWKKMNRPVYNLLKDVDIKKLLSDLQLPTTGDREVRILYDTVVHATVVSLAMD